jgi:LmbE family N-acetylglucosaminyl deacetylase
MINHYCNCSTRFGGILFLLRLTVAWVIALLMASAAGAQILVLAPHPDDDIITSAGIIYDAHRRGEPVTVVYLTNGDFNGTNVGFTRQNEAVTAQTQYLGTLESELIFLGYPDGYTMTLYNSYPRATDWFTAPNGQSVTYGHRGLGGSDYHFYRFGAHALYNRANMVLDLTTILQTYRPAHIFTTGQYDSHPDHETAYNVLKEALTSVLTDASYKPVVHTTVVHSPCCDPSNGGREPYWPDLVNATRYFSILPDIPTVPLDWSKRESLDVPLTMQQSSLSNNIKYLATLAHVSQLGDDYLQRFVHKDEVFWPENPRGLNRPPIVNAGVDQQVLGGALVSLNGSGSSDPEALPLTFEWSQAEGPVVTLTGANTASPTFTAPQLEQTTKFVFRLVVRDGEFASPPDLVAVTVAGSSMNIAPLAAVTASSDYPPDGQEATKAVDGVVDGWPEDSTREWATDGERAGAWIRLSWATSYVVDRVVLYDRPNANDRVTGGKLTFSDGTSVSVGALNNAGAATTVTFTPRSITSVTFTVTSVSATTENIGLAEFEVYVTQGAPSAPAAPSGLTATATSSSQINLAWVDNATNETGYSIERSTDGTTFTVVATLGANVTTYANTGLAAATTYSYRVRAANSAGTSAYSNTATATTSAAATSTNIASLAAVTASSDNPADGQQATKAVDGVVDGWPGDYTREWATNGQRAGAWITLSWSVPYLVDRVVLYDRPNSSDRVTGGTLTFSDGTTVSVTSLSNNGAAKAVTFTARSVTSVTFTVTSVSTTTQNVGLAEIEVYGR